MAQELRTINLNAPAFKGINSEDSPITQDTAFAEVADNAVIDKRGRIAARKGYSVYTTNATVLDPGGGGDRDSLSMIKEFKDDQGNKKIFSSGNDKIFISDPLTGLTTLTDETPAGYTITDNDWKAVSFNNKIYFFQRGYEPLVYDNATNDVQVISALATAGGTANVHGNEAVAAYGRLWVADFENLEKSKVYWSDLLIGENFTSGSSGSIDISKVWPDGRDEIVALAAHNGLLIIFGKHSIVVYKGAESPTSMVLADTISGVGCVDRNTVQNTGTDILFLSDSGLRSFGRTIQSGSMPLQILSGNITKDIIEATEQEKTLVAAGTTIPSAGFRTVYSPENNFYLLTFAGQRLTYCFDVRGTLENGAYRVTRWPTYQGTAYTETEDGDLLVGTIEGLCKYDTYLDDNATYTFKYLSPRLSFGDTSRTKLLKKIKPTIIGANNATVALKWAYDFSDVFNTTTLTVGTSQEPAYFASDINAEGASQFNVNKFSTGVNISRLNGNTTGYGNLVTIGLEATINGSEFSVQELNVLALMGKIF
jgi:hypothetical protein